ncbi:MAG: hypothetical protein KIB43_07960 [Clostridium baratii]|uniref:hypothetical protein n=1 Tax=Clostridium baratii TaxID=1561 RepID=UPI00242EABF9|nr:hypothetical protein [Clostridium baratii]MBS6006883.1 hypothetical protein [Clostridium baratii]
MDINLIQEEMFSLIPDAADIIPSDFDFKNEIGIEIKVGDSITDRDYCKEIDLQIRIVGFKDKKFDIQGKGTDIDKIINGYRFKNTLARIVRENVYYSSYYDDDKFNVVLMYIIRKY